MKKRVFGLLAVLCSCGVAQANEAITAANNELGVSIGGQNIAYHELPSSGGSAGPDGYLDSQIGTMPAVSLNVSRQGSLFGISNVYVAASINAAWGKTEYTTGKALFEQCNGIPGQPGYGTFCTSSFGSEQFKTQNVWVDAQARIGKGFEVSPRVQITPYVEFGGHYWDRNAAGNDNATASGAGTEDYYWNLLAGAGVLSQYAVTDRLVVGLDVAALENFSANAHVNGQTYPMGSRPMFVGAIGADYAITKRLHVTASYTLQHFRYGSSPSESCSLSRNSVMQCNAFGAVEPSDWTTTQAVMVGLAYSFR